MEPFSENSDVLQLMKIGPFWGLLSGSLELDQLASLAQNSLVLMTNKAREALSVLTTNPMSLYSSVYLLEFNRGL